MPLRIQTLTVGGTGLRMQAEGLAQAILAQIGGEVHHSEVVQPLGIRLLPLPLAAAFSRAVSGPAVDIVIGCGNRVQAATLATARRHGAFAVYIQRSRSGEKLFDAIIAPQHDYPPEAAEALEKQADSPVLLTVGSVGGINVERIAAAKSSAEKRFAHLPRPRIGVLIGGSNRAYQLTPQHCRALAEQILAAAPKAGFMVTASHRTDADCRRVLAEAFAGDNCFYYDGEGPDNPYLQMLAEADLLLVTGESVNMLCEAVSAAKPVCLLELPQTSMRAAVKFQRLHATLMEQGLLRLWQGRLEEWTAPGLDETGRAAEFVLSRYRRMRKA